MQRLQFCFSSSVNLHNLPTFLQGPGIFFIVPCIDTYKKLDLRTVSFDVPPQEILSRDSVTVSVDAVVYYRFRNNKSASNL